MNAKQIAQGEGELILKNREECKSDREFSLSIAYFCKSDINIKW